MMQELSVDNLAMLMPLLLGWYQIITILLAVIISGKLMWIVPVKRKDLGIAFSQGHGEILALVIIAWMLLCSVHVSKIYFH